MLSAPLNSGNSLRIVATINVNVEDTWVGMVCRDYLESHMSNVMNAMTLVLNDVHFFLLRTQYLNN